MKIDDISIKANGEADLITLKKDGKVTIDNSTVGVLSNDGKFRDLSGKTIAEINKQGKVTDRNKKILATVNKNGEVDNGSGEKFGWTKDGKFSVSGKDFFTIAPDKKKFYQTAAFLIFLYMSVKESKIGVSSETQMP